MPESEAVPADEQAMVFAAAERRRAEFEHRLAAVLREWADVEEDHEHKKVLLARANHHERAAEHHERAATHQEAAAERMRDWPPAVRTRGRWDVILREPTKRGDKVKVSFVLPSDNEPADIFVVGDFNAWNPGSTKLRRRGDTRSASVTLTAGRRYAFRYYRNGRWFNDDHADGYETNEYGEQNCIIDLR